MQLICKHIYVLTGQVAYRMTYNQSSHIRVRFGVYHFVRRVPADLQHHYRSDRVSISLRTKSANVARRTAQSICQRLEDYWHGLRLQKMDVPALHLVISDAPDVQDNNERTFFGDCFNLARKKACFDSAPKRAVGFGLDNGFCRPDTDCSSNRARPSSI